MQNSNKKDPKQNKAKAINRTKPNILNKTLSNYNKDLSSFLSTELKLIFNESDDREKYFGMLAFNELLFRLNKSLYWHKFVIKGGYYLASIIAKLLRLTKDLDLDLIDKDIFDNNKLKNIFEEIINIKTNSDFKFKNLRVIDRDESKKRIYFTVQYGTKTKDLHIDLSKVDNKNLNIEIGLESVNFKDIDGFTNEALNNIQTYSLEQVSAIKFLLIIKEGHRCRRIKDYFDFIYVVTSLTNILDVNKFLDYIYKEAPIKLNYKKEEIPFEIVIKAMRDIIDEIEHSESVKQKWNELNDKLFLRDDTFNIEFKFVVKILNELVNHLENIFKEETKESEEIDEETKKLLLNRNIWNRER